MKRVRKAVIPAAGLGTRFLPATKAIPKEMLPIVDKPTIQYVVEEAVSSGLEDVILVTSQGKNEIEDHFDYDPALEHLLREQGKKDLLQTIREIPHDITLSSVRQRQPLGLGHAVQVTESLVGDEPFGVFLGDDIIVGDIPGMRQLLNVYDKHHASVVAVQEVPWDVVSLYGLVAVEAADEEDDRLFRIKDMVEKPPRDKAPSNLAIIGRYILTPGIFGALRRTKPGKGGEIQLTDGLRELMKEEPVYAYRFKGTRYDVGNKLEYVIANVDLALQRPELAEGLANHLRNVVRNL